MPHVEQALTAFYTQPEPVRSNAHNWLMGLQRSPKGWDVSVALLQSQSTLEVQMFAASMLQAKIQANWNEVPAASQTKLLQTVLDLLKQKAQQQQSGARPLLTRLCVCVVAIALYLVPVGAWPTYVADIFSMIQQGGEAMLLVALQILTISAEELGRPHLLRDQKVAMSKALNAAIPSVLALLQSLLVPEQTDESRKRDALKCLLGWLNCEALVIPIKDFLGSPILGSIFDALKSEELFLLAVEVLGEVTGLKGLDKYPVALNAIAQKVLGLRSSYQKAVEEEDEETAKGICQVLIRLGESFTHQLFAHDEIGRPFVEFALACMSHESREVSMVTLNFWFDLEEYLVSSTDGKPKREAYTPVFRHLLPLLVQASRFPEDFDDLPKDLRDEFIEFRNEVKDTLLYVQLVLEAETLAIIVSLMQKELVAMQTPAEAELKATHRNIEALLFGMVSIAEGIDASEDTFLPQIIGQLLFVLPTTPLVAATAIRLIGELAGWFKKHPTCLEPAIRYLLSTTVSPLLRFSALTSLKQLTEKCGKHLHQVLEPMLATYESLSDSFSARERGAMIESLTHIIATIPHQPALQALQRIVPPVIQKITAILAIQEQTQYTRQALIAELSTVAGVCRCLDCPSLTSGQPDDHPLMPVLKAVWPVLDFCFKNCSGDSGIIKANCQILRHSLLSMKAYFLPLLPTLTALLTGSFERHHNPQLVSLLAVTANIFNATSHAQALEWLSGAITAISTSFFTIMSQGANQVDPDLVDAYYKDLLLQFWRFNPQVVPLNLLDTVYQSAVASLLVFKERRVLQAVHSLLQAVTSEDRNEHAAAVRDALLQKHGKTLLHTLFTGLAGPLSRSEFAPVARLLSALVNVRPTWFREWATELFAVPSFPSAVISPDKKKKFITDAMSIKNRERFERVVSEFALQCRGLTEVGGTF